MSEWKSCTLGDIAKINPTERLSKGTIAPKITMDALHAFTKKVSGFSYEEYKGGAKFRNGDTLIARITPCLENGKTAFMNILEDDELAFGSTEFIVLREKESLSDKEFLYYFSISPEFRDIAISSMTGSSGRQRVSTDVVTNHVFEFPPIAEQKAIAEVLSSLDDKIDLLHRQNKTLESLAETLFRHYFIDNTQDDWGYKKLGDFITPKKGKNLTKDQAVEGPFPVVAGGLSPSCYHNECNTKAPVVTVSASGANAGFVCLHYEPVWSSDSSFVDYSVTPYVYFFYIFLKINQSNITDKQEGSAQPHIYPSHLMDLDILNYPEKLMLDYENKCACIFGKISKNILQFFVLEKLRDTLLPKFISGDVLIRYKEAI